MFTVIQFCSFFCMWHSGATCWLNAALTIYGIVDETPGPIVDRFYCNPEARPLGACVGKQSRPAVYTMKKIAEYICDGSIS